MRALAVVEDLDGVVNADPEVGDDLQLPSVNVFGSHRCEELSIVRLS